MNILLNYANGYSRRLQKLSNRTGMHIGGFDSNISLSPKDIDRRFWRENRAILTQKRLGGYGLWKPYIILKVLETLPPRDVLFYCDSDSFFVAPVKPLTDLFERTKQDVIPFELEYYEYAWTKRDAFILMECDTPEYTHSPQMLDGYHLWRKSETSLRFLREWLAYARDARISTDIPNQLGLDNYDGFKENRHEQTIFSLLVKKYGFEAFRDPSQFGNDRAALYKNSPYWQIVCHLGWKNRSRMQDLKHRFWKMTGASTLPGTD